MEGKIEVPMDVRYSKLGDVTSTGKNGHNIRANASHKMRQDQVSGKRLILIDPANVFLYKNKIIHQSPYRRIKRLSRENLPKLSFR